MKALIAGLVLAAAVTRSATGQGRDEEYYYPGRFNWMFRATYPAAARLFNAFDYGHAVLSERLFSAPDDISVVEVKEFGYLVDDLLARPPAFAVAEEAVMPRYSRAVWRAQLMFDRAHILHRQIYDVLSDSRLAPAEQSALIEKLTDYYLGDRYAFTVRPKAMELMEGQPYSLVFKRRFPKFNGLIWAYHWLQVGLYESLLAESDSAGKRASIDESLARFRAMTVDPPKGFPTVMPMTAAVAPTFAATHPRAAVVFDNLHMMHDIISDILASDQVPRAKKVATINQALDEFQDGTRNVIDVEHWLMMAEHMGGVAAMGGVAGRRRPPK